VSLWVAPWRRFSTSSAALAACFSTPSTTRLRRHGLAANTIDRVIHSGLRGMLRDAELAGYRAPDLSQLFDRRFVTRLDQGSDAAEIDATKGISAFPLVASAACRSSRRSFGRVLPRGTMHDSAIVTGHVPSTRLARWFASQNASGERYSRRNGDGGIIVTSSITSGGLSWPDFARPRNRRRRAMQREEPDADNRRVPVRGSADRGEHCLNS